MITEVKLAEVLEVNYDNNHIKVRTVADNIERTYDVVPPADLNNLKLPLIGEHVIIVKALQNESNYDIRRYDWYYLTTYSLQFNVNNNLLPGVTTKLPKETAGFIDTNINSLQVYPGDIVYQGRWGNTIRLGSSIDTKPYSNQPTWLGDKKTSPIIILSNRKSSKVESVNNDYSSLWLTSTQTVNFTLNNKLRKTNRFESQLIGTADRIILKSKSDVVALDSGVAVEINAPITSFGVSDKKEQMLHSTVIIEVINSIIQVLLTGNADSAGNISTPILVSKLVELQNKLLRNGYNKKMLQDKES